MGLKVAGHGGSVHTANRLKQAAAAQRELQAGRKSEPPRGNPMKNSLISAGEERRQPRLDVEVREIEKAAAQSFSR